MSQAVLLDAGPLGLVTNPRRSPQSAACATWLQSLVTAGVRVVIPEIADYEVRRELLRARKTAGIEKLAEGRRAGAIREAEVAESAGTALSGR